MRGGEASVEPDEGCSPVVGENMESMPISTSTSSEGLFVNGMIISVLAVLVSVGLDDGGDGVGWTECRRGFADVPCFCSATTTTSTSSLLVPHSPPCKAYSLLLYLKHYVY